MIKDNSHSIARPVDATDTVTEDCEQVVERVKQDIGQEGPLQLVPQSLHPVQTEAVRWQPEYGDPIGVEFELLLHRLGVTKLFLITAQPARCNPQIPSTRGLRICHVIILG